MWLARARQADSNDRSRSREYQRHGASSRRLRVSERAPLADRTFVPHATTAADEDSIKKTEPDRETPQRRARAWSATTIERTKTVEESILVGVTDTPASRRAVDWAAQRAQESNGRVELISIVGGATGAVGEGAVVDEALAKTQKMLDREAERIKARDIAIDTRVGRGNPVEELINASMVFDLLVIGSDHRGPGPESRRGPHGIRIVAGAHSPVAVVPDIDIAGRRGVIVGVDGSLTSERAIEFAAAEADRVGDQLTAVTTWSTVPLPVGLHGYPTTYLSGMQKLAEETLSTALAGIGQSHPNLVVQRVVERGDADATINRLAAEARLVVIGSRGRGMIARFLLGSTSQEVLTHIATTTVVIR